MKKNNKYRLFEMMNKVANTNYLLNEEAKKGAKILIKNISPSTIGINEVLPSTDIADAGDTMLTPEQIDNWKTQFIAKFGDEGYLEKGLALSWKWEVVNNNNYDEWKNKYLSTKGTILNKERESERSYGLD